jgi:hypothetical protein
VRFAVDAWDPDYGASFDADLVDAAVPVDATIERAEPDWAPIDPLPAAISFDQLTFVDGVRRVEAHVWVTAPDGSAHHGICASYAAGTVRCNGRAEIGEVLVRRALFCHPDGAESIVTRHGEFTLHAVGDDDPMAQSLALQRSMGRLEVEAAGPVGDGSLVVVDGPLREGQLEPGFVGFVKTHRTRYGPPVVAATVAQLAPGQRTPLLWLGGARPRFTWYLRLPGPIDHAWAGVVRLEIAAESSIEDAVRHADGLGVALPPFASTPHKDRRAPQNLYPIAGLERELRRRLGDPALVLRALRTAAVAAA